MNSKKLKVIIILCSILLLILIFLSTLIGKISNNKKEGDQVYNNSTKEDTTYSFREKIDLDSDNSLTTSDAGTETDADVVSSYYDEDDVRYQDDKMYVESFNGEEVVSQSWMNEGYAVYINQPDFGTLTDFILSDESITVTYTDVTMKDVISYINELAGLGFNEVVNDEKNSKSDYYIYTSLNGERTATLNYEKGKLVIFVY